MSLSPEQVEQFVRDGYVRLDDAFPRAAAEECRAILWRETGCDPSDPRTWAKPVVRLGDHAEPCFAACGDTPRLRAAFDALVGPGRWLPRRTLGTFPVRFPSTDDPGDTGWHVDSSFPGPDPGDYFSYRINVHSRSRALLLLFLFSDTTELDAPTRLRVGSHRHVARLLAPLGDAGLDFRALAARLAPTAALPEATATGPAGTVYLCHPLLVHAGSAHRTLGRPPRFLAQPPLHPRTGAGVGDALRPLDPTRPVARAIREGLEEG